MAKNTFTFTGGESQETYPFLNSSPGRKNGVNQRRRHGKGLLGLRSCPSNSLRGLPRVVLVLGGFCGITSLSSQQPSVHPLASACHVPLDVQHGFLFPETRTPSLQCPSTLPPSLSLWTLQGHKSGSLHLALFPLGSSQTQLGL